MPGSSVTQQGLVAGDKRQPILPCGCGQDAIGRITVQAWWKAAGLEEDGGREWKHAQASVARCFLNEMVDCGTQGEVISQGQQRYLPSGDGGEIGEAMTLPVLDLVSISGVSFDAS